MSEKEMIECKWVLEVGCLYYSAAENIIKGYCFQKGYSCTIEKGAGILSKPFYVTITLPKEDKQQVISDLQYLFDEARG